MRIRYVVGKECLNARGDLDFYPFRIPFHNLDEAIAFQRALGINYGLYRQAGGRLVHLTPEMIKHIRKETVTSQASKGAIARFERLSEKICRLHGLYFPASWLR